MARSLFHRGIAVRLGALAAATTIGAVVFASPAEGSVTSRSDVAARNLSVAHAVVTPTATISGTISAADPTVAVAGVAVDVFDLRGAEVATAQADWQGLYTVQQLPAGSYRVQFYGQLFASQYYGGSPFPSGATTIEVADGQQVTGIDARLVDQATISGTMEYSSVLYSSSAKDVYVGAYAQDPVSGQEVQLGGAFLYGGGAYTIGNLPAGTYRLKFESYPQGLEPKYPYVLQYWNGASNPLTAATITLTAGQALTGIDQYLQDSPPSRIAHDYSGDGHPDLLAITNTGLLYSYMSNGHAGWNSPAAARVGSGWSGMRLVVAPGDFDGDGHPDIIALDGSGRLWLYPGDGHNSWKPRRLVASGWQGMTALVGVGDWDDDGVNDLAARDAAGTLRVYPGDGRGGINSAAVSAIGTGWNAMTSIVGGTDFTSDGLTDIVARDASGVLWVYPRWYPAGWAPRIAIGSGWNAMTSIVSVGNMMSDPTQSSAAPPNSSDYILARDASGALWLYTYNNNVRTYNSGVFSYYSGWDPRQQIGSGWSLMSWIG